MDCDSGQILYGENYNLIRHPASMTKIMTVYVLFEALKKKRISMQDKFKVSKRASSQQPTKIGLQPGEVISVFQLIDSMIIKSANDSAVTAAEGLEGSEIAFARVMTNTARRLGMTKTVFKNSSGLPDRAQVTTAFEMAKLAQALINYFPNEYRRFQKPSMQFRGRFLRNSNKLLSSVEGVDGLKTGFINMSGHNVTISAKRNGRRIIIVVMGGRTSQERWNVAKNLVEVGFNIIFNNGKPPSNNKAAVQRVNYGQETENIKPSKHIMPTPRPSDPSKNLDPDTMDALVRNVANQHHIPSDTEVKPAILKPVHYDPIKIIIENDSVNVITPISREALNENSKKTAPKSAKPSKNIEKVAVSKEKSPAPIQVWYVKIGQFKAAADAIDLAKTVVQSGGGTAGIATGFAQGKKILHAKVSGLSKENAMAICKIQAAKGQTCTPVAQAQ